jgi:hypothetical protein
LDQIIIDWIIGFYKKFRVPILILLLGLSILILWPFLISVKLQYFDFNVFWNASYHTLRHINPYTADWFPYPPWVILFFLPFGLLPFNISRLLWYLLCVGLILYSCNRIWIFYQGPKNYRYLAWLTGITFSASLFALIWGQLSPLVLLGIILFIENCDGNDKKYIWLSLSIFLIAMKPHILFLFWPALFLWSVKRRQWRLLIISPLSLIGATICVSLFVPEIIPSFIQSILRNPPSNFGTPTLGYWLRINFGEQKYWLQFLPFIFGFIWFCYYWNRNKNTWRWADNLTILIFGSILTTPHSWTHDYLILLPGILQGVISYIKGGKKRNIILFIIIWLAFNLAIVLLHFRVGDYWFYGESLLILWFYLATTHSRISPKRTMQEAG